MVVVVGEVTGVGMEDRPKAEEAVGGRAKVVVGQAEAGEAGMVVVEEVVDMEVHHDHIVAEEGADMEEVAEKLE
jgi:hypothetical protein